MPRLGRGIGQPNGAVSAHSGYFLLVGTKSARRTTNGDVDPSHKFGLRHDSLLTAVADHVAGCNAGWLAATSAEPRCAVCSVQGGQPMKIVAKFTTSDGKVTTATFDRATGTVVSDDGRKGTYKREGNILKLSGDQSFTITMQGNIPDPPTAGFTAPYTSSIGTTGTMTIVSVG